MLTAVGRRVIRSATRVVFYCLKSVAVMLAYVDHRSYMLLYTRLLRAFGMDIDGRPRYIAKSVYFDDFERIHLADRCVISTNVSLLTHDYSMTTALIAVGEHPIADIAAVKDIRLGRNVFVGRNAILMPGTEIGDNVIVGAGAVVRGKVPSNTVVIGNPAAAIRSMSDHAVRCTRHLASPASVRSD